MPDASGRIPPVSLHGVKNAWLDSLERDVPCVRVDDQEGGVGVSALEGSSSFGCHASDDECAVGCDWPSCIS